MNKRSQKWLTNYSNQLPESSRAAYTSVARRFLEWLEDRQPDADIIRRYEERMRRATLADGTIRKNWGILRRLLIVNGVFAPPGSPGLPGMPPWPFRRGDAPTVREMEEYAPALHPDDVHAMIDFAMGRARSESAPAVDERHRAFLCLSTMWGLRQVEMVQMKPEYLDTSGKLLFIETAKHGRQRWHTVPDHILPILQEWGFKEPMSSGQLWRLFGQMKVMIGFAGPDAYGIGWHSIRRTVDKMLRQAGLDEETVRSFLRWKRSTTNMVARYASHPFVGRKGTERALGSEDRTGDEQVLALHPFVNLWKEKPELE